MPTFKVLLTRDTTESAVVTIIAKSQTVARLQAANLPDEELAKLKWERDDTYPDRPYLADE